MPFTVQNVPFTRTVWKFVQSPGVIFLVTLGIRLWAESQVAAREIWMYFYQYNEPARIAWALVSGHGYSSPWANTPLNPTAQQPPVYPLLLAGIFKLTGAYSSSSLWIAVVLNASFSGLTAIAILRLGQKKFGALVGVLAAWVWSCWLYEAVMAIRIWESSLSALFLAAGLLLLPELGTELRSTRWLIFGALTGLAALTNATLLAVFPLFWLWLWVGYRRRGISCNRSLLPSIAICLLVMVPWTVRNYATFHRFIPIRDNLGLELSLGNHEGVTSASDFPVLNPAEYNRLGEIPFMESKRQIALQFIHQHPAEFLRLSVRRWFLFWTAPDHSAWRWISLLAWLGLVLALRDKGWEAVPYAIVLVTFPVIYYITHTYDTYRHPIEPAILLLAAYALVNAVEAASAKLAPVRRSSG